MLVHKGGHINNVQLITGVRIAEMSQLQNCSVMCTKNGSYCENEKKQREKVRGERGCVQRMEVIVERKGRCERRSEAFVKIKKKIYIFFFWGGGGGGGGGSGQGAVRVDGNGEVKLV